MRGTRAVSIALAAVLAWTSVARGADPITRNDLPGTWRSDDKKDPKKDIVITPGDSTDVRRCNKWRNAVSTVDDLKFVQHYTEGGNTVERAWKGVSYNSANNALTLVQCPGPDELPDKDKHGKGPVPDWAKSLVTADDANPALEYDIAMTLSRGFVVFGPACSFSMKGQAQYGSFEVMEDRASVDQNLGPKTPTATYTLVRHHLPDLATPLLAQWQEGQEPGPSERGDEIMGAVRGYLLSNTAISTFQELLATLVESIVSAAWGLSGGEEAADKLYRTLAKAIGQKFIEKLVGNAVRGQLGYKSTDVGKILVEAVVKFFLRDAPTPIRVALEKSAGGVLGFTGLVEKGKQQIDKKLSADEQASLTKWALCRFAFVEIPPSSKLDATGISGGYAVVDTVTGNASVWIGVEAKGSRPAHILEGTVGGLPEDSEKYWPANSTIRFHILV